MDDIYVVYITCPNNEEALSLSRILVKKHLCACANILPQITSIYHWDNKICEEPEVLIIIKTAKSRIDDLIKEAKKRHSYEVPEIIALPVSLGNPDYINWVINESKNKD